jgi:hypothetical protein
MKYIFLIVSILISTTTFSQHPFLKHKLTFGTRPWQIELADIDNDNDLDIVAAYAKDRVLAYYTNDGTGYFDSCVVVSEMIDSVSSVAVAADLNNDGKVDLVTRGSKSIHWYKNLGNGNFSTILTISDSVYTFPKVYTADLDNDSLIDVLFWSYSDDKVGWYKNLGSGLFGPEQLLNDSIDGPRSVWTADINNDGLQDVLSSSQYDSSVVWYENIGNGNFDSQQVIADTVARAGFTLASDLDNDGLMDVVYQNDSTIVWKRNLGNGVFSTESIISNNIVGGPNYVFPIDLDHDNDTDLIVPIKVMGMFYWHENLGGGIFGPKQIISDSIDGPLGCYVGDIDGDGAHDIIAGGYSENTISVFNNRDNNTFDLTQVISNVTSDVRHVYADDLDNDGLTDILSASEEDDKIGWFKNLGNQNFSTQKIITDSLDEAECVITADLDNDGRPDVISGGRNDSLIWQRNLGSGSLGSPQVISIQTNAIQIKAKDLNNDGWIDIVAVFAMGGSPLLYWCENLGYGDFGSGNFILFMSGLNDFKISDINNDGFEDLVLCSGSTYGYGFNDGTGNFQVIQYITGIYGAMAIDVKDMNQDGFKDIVATGKTSSLSDYYLKWLPNDGTGNFSTEIIIDTLPNYAYTTFAADMNNDSLIDIVVASKLVLHWVENLGLGNFGPLQDIDFSGGRIFSIYPADLDNDHDVDIILANFGNSEVLWYENTLNNLIDTIIVCVGDSALIMGNWENQPGDYMDSLVNMAGGDSIVIIRLENYPTYYPVDTVEICDGDFYDFHGQILTTAGVYYSTFQSSHGCDSIVELPLTLIPVPLVNISEFNPDSTSINGGFVDLPPASPPGGEYSGTGVTNNSFDPSISGTGEFWISYTYTDTITGCSNQDSTYINVYDPVEIAELLNNEVKLYPNPGKDCFILDVWNTEKTTELQLFDVQGRQIIQREIKERTSSINTSNLSAGVYTYVVKEQGEIIATGKWVKQ